MRPYSPGRILQGLTILLCLSLYTACGGGSSSNSVVQQGPPEASISATTVTFAGQKLNTTSTAATVSVSNSGGGSLSVSGVSFSGTNASEFSQTNNCGSLSAGRSCTINITFRPTATGSRTATLSVSNSATSGPQTVSLTGAGLSSSSTADQLGTAAGDPVSCASIQASAGEPNGTCYNVTLTCPGVADEVVGVKVNNPTGTKGTVTFMVGGGGKPWYDQNFMFGTNAVDLVAQAGFTTAQIDFYAFPTGFPSGGTFAGWLTGPGGLHKLACRFGTVEKWVYDNIRQPSQPFCHTGNSGGAGGPAYLLSYYGFDAYFNFLELSSGPPFTRIDHGCICSPEQFQTVTCGGSRSQSECFQSDGTDFIDPAYDPKTHVCTDAWKNNDTSNQQMFIDDSIATSSAVYSYPHVKMHFVFGGLDTGSAEPQAIEWINGSATAPPITANGPITSSCVEDAPHPIPDVLDGAQQIANDVIANCN